MTSGRSRHHWPDERRCQAMTQADSWRASERCTNSAIVLVNRKRLCSKHGMMEALAELVRAGAARILPHCRNPFAPVPTEAQSKPSAE